MNMLTVVFILLACALAFIAGALSVHAYPTFDWKIGGVHDWLQKRIRVAFAWRDAVKAWFAAKKSRV